MARFYLDNCFPTQTAEVLRRLGHDAVTTRDRGRSAARDDDQLLYAANDARILVTHNWTDFRLLHDAWRRWTKAWAISRAHAGILALDQGLHWQQYGAEIDRYVSVTANIENELHRYRLRPGWLYHPAP